MKSIGSILFIYGVAAIVMNFLNAVPRLLVWIYNWGEGPAWAIKIAFVIVGAALWWMGSKNSSQEAAPTDSKPDNNPPV